MISPELQNAIVSGVTYVASKLMELLNSAFGLSLVGALAGAVAGAFAAQRVIERSKMRDELLKEIRSVNAANTVSFTICNTVLGMKKQLVLPMYDRFIRDETALQNFRKQKQTGQRQGNEPFRFQADLLGFMSPIIPIETLKMLVYERINAYGKPLNLVSLIENAGVGLVKAIEKRDCQMEDFKLMEPSETMIARYFGEEMANGHTYREFSDVVKIIHEYTEELIYFSVQLCIELTKHGEMQSKRFTKQFGKGSPVVYNPDFSGPRNIGLIPSDEKYSAWSKWMPEASSNVLSGISK